MARDFMREKGNPYQWGDAYPPVDLIKHDISAGSSYVCTNGKEISAVFYFAIEPEPTYLRIDGRWLNDIQYGVVHRLATDRRFRGTGAFCLDWCYKQCLNLRIDTHRDNAPMISRLDKSGFTCCGVIWVENGDERLAFQKA